ncbi:uncharacterized protein LOC116574292 isoform X2 [Mustela erminea]|uniref:uncharacterized protein LOC116574292 isoform X2 n=1 Tax=Mustela erminea TaxID=36723 RepID=UPI0013873EE6|nr:uncharacterized protein LOC116574292 isoform X2 [Mustela erminea]
MRLVSLPGGTCPSLCLTSPWLLYKASPNLVASITRNPFSHNSAGQRSQIRLTGLKTMSTGRAPFGGAGGPAIPCVFQRLVMQRFLGWWPHGRCLCLCGLVTFSSSVSNLLRIQYRIAVRTRPDNPGTSSHLKNFELKSHLQRCFFHRRMKWKVVKPEIKTSLRRFYYTDPGEIRRNRQWGPASGKRGDLPSLRLWNLIIICNFLLSLITKLQQFHPRNDT